jgi:phosphonate transport system permease protein
MTQMIDSGARTRISEARRLLPRAFHRPALERLKLYGGWAVFLGLVAYTLVLFDFTPARIAGGFGKLADVLGFMLPPHVWATWEEFLEPVAAIGETLAMAFLGTLFAAVVALPLGFLGARNVLRLPVLRFGVRRGFDALRSLEQIILALIFIRAFGLGPLAGIFAIAVSDIGSLSKLFAEAIENVDRRPVEGVTAAGASRLQALRLAVTPQVLPVLTSHVLYYFESNTRSASTLGIVGAGGIGYTLADRIGANNWPEVMSILILLLITVGAIDAVSGRLRSRVIAGAPLPTTEGRTP